MGTQCNSVTNYVKDLMRKFGTPLSIYQGLYPLQSIGRDFALPSLI